ncbi:MAG TPA: hypothetical protein VG652_09810, partial [Gaiellaceae bacterium]|nr:hypothetical protein [Gaiellaceae bacterium]
MRTRPWRNPAAVRLVLVAALVLLGALVVAGAFTRLDQYAVDHWMAQIGTGRSSLWRALLPYPNGGSASELAINIWTFPGSVPASALVLAVCFARLARRGQRNAGAAWIAAWVVANAVELTGKGVLDRPPLTTLKHGVRVDISGFESS